MSRDEFAAATKRAAATRSQGVCECDRMTADIRGAFPKACDRVAAEFDHIRACILGGEATLENCAHLCTPCHKIKTALDKADMAKMHRHEVNRSRKPKTRTRAKVQFKQSRGFDKTKTRGFDGIVRDRT